MEMGGGRWRWGEADGDGGGRWREVDGDGWR